MVPPGAALSVGVIYAPQFESAQDERGNLVANLAELIVESHTNPTQSVVALRGAAEDFGCPIADIKIAQGHQIAPRTLLQLTGGLIHAPSGPAATLEWSVSQPPGSAAAFVPSADVPQPTFTPSVAGLYIFELMIWDESGAPACAPARFEVNVAPGPGIYVELVWSGEGADLDLHFAHPFADSGKKNSTGEPLPWYDPVFDVSPFNRSPDWGELNSPIDDPNYDADHSNAPGPESVHLSQPEPGATYRVGAHYLKSTSGADALATVRIYIDGTLAGAWEDVQLNTSDLWEPARVTWLADGTAETTEVLRPNILKYSAFPK